MLSPDTGVTLGDALRPPDGYQLDIAVGTTFTLDLVALLAIPTAFSFAPSVRDDTADHEHPPLGRLEALRTYSSRITVFTDAAHISLPTTSAGTLLGFLDDSVVPVRAPLGGYFHPKIWIVRFRAHGDFFLHRVLIPSRNLTFDRSRDTLALLDEARSDDKSDTATTLPTLYQLLTDLPDLAVGAGPTDIRLAQLDDLSRTVATARFVPPSGFDSMQLHCLGFTGTAHASPLPTDAIRSLIVSPFLGTTLPEGISSQSDKLTLVSRPAALDSTFAGVPEDKRPNSYVLNPGLIDDADAPDSGVNDGSSAENDTVANDETETGGLHAKLFVFDRRGNRTSMFTGSANATENAFRKNSEVLLRLDGPSHTVGVSHILQAQAPDQHGDVHPSLMSILVPHTWSEPVDDEQSDTEKEVADLRTALSAIAVRADVTALPVSDSAVEAVSRFTVVYSTTDSLDVPRGMTVQVRPITQTEWHRYEGGPLATSFTLPVHQLTRFLGVRIRMGDTTASFVLAAEMHGAPEDRSDQLLSHLIESPERPVRYLIMLLSDLPEDRFGNEATGALERYAGPGSDLRTVPLLELMLRALVAAPDRLREVDRLMSLVAKDSDLVDENLMNMWTSVSKLMGSKK